MKRYIGLLLIALSVFSLQSCMIKRGANMDFAKGTHLAKEAEVVSIRVPGILMKAFIRSEIKELREDDPALAMALKKIKKLKFMAVSGGGKSGLHNKFNQYLADNNFEELMSLYSDGSKISINTRTKGDRIKQIMLGITDEDDHVFVDVKSDIDLNELNELIAHYEEVQEKKSQEKSSEQLEAEVVAGAH